MVLDLMLAPLLLHLILHETLYRLLVSQKQSNIFLSPRVMALHICLLAILPSMLKVTSMEVNPFGASSFRVPSVSISNFVTDSKCGLKIMVTSIPMQPAKDPKSISVGVAPFPSPKYAGVASIWIS